jgi:hypothetical protein
MPGTIAITFGDESAERLQAVADARGVSVAEAFTQLINEAWEALNG